MFSKQLQCNQCGWWTLCGSNEVVRRLRTLGLLRRAPDPPDELVAELLTTYGPRLKCDRCDSTSLNIADLANDESANDLPGDWQQARICEICRTPIAEERLAIVPDATRCTSCQTAADAGQTPVEIDYCPKCGAAMELRTAAVGGITRYKLFCTSSPPCRL